MNNFMKGDKFRVIKFVGIFLLLSISLFFFLIVFYYSLTYIYSSKTPDYGENYFAKSNTPSLSNFGNQVCKCTGSCYCDIEERRMTSASPTLIKRGLTIFFASTASVFALQRAKSYFQEKCQSRYSMECPSHAIKSDVQGCGCGSDDAIETDELDDASDPSFIYDKKDIQIYKCKGQCLKNENLQTHKESGAIDVDGFDCSKFSSEGEVQVLNGIEGMKQSYYDKRAIQIFQVYKLRGYCRSTSNTKFETKEFGVINAVMCTEGGSYDINPTIECEKVGVVEDD